MRKPPTFLQGFLIVLGGLAFAVFGCLGAISGGAFASGSPSSMFVLGGFVFVAGLLAALYGGVIFIIATFKALFAKRDGTS
jgi:hypothetical protein